MGARSKARRRALDVLYEADQRILTARDVIPGDPPEPTTPEFAATAVNVLAERLVRTTAQTSLPEYSVEIVEGVAAHIDRIDEALTTYSQGWTLPRMPAVDRAALRLGAWEILANDDVPDAVAIDEAVALVQDLSTDESPDFVNGLLGRVAKLKASL